MTETAAFLATSYLSRSDRLDLLEMLPLGAAKEHWPKLPAGEQGEASQAILLISLTMASLAGVSAWLATRGIDVEMRFSVEALGTKTGFSFIARHGDTAAELAHRMADNGIPVPPESSAADGPSLATGNE